MREFLQHPLSWRLLTPILLQYECGNIRRSHGTDGRHALD